MDVALTSQFYEGTEGLFHSIKHRELLLSKSPIRLDSPKPLDQTQCKLHQNLSESQRNWQKFWVFDCDYVDGFLIFWLNFSCWIRFFDKISWNWIAPRMSRVPLGFVQFTGFSEDGWRWNWAMEKLKNAGFAFYHSLC